MARKRGRLKPDSPNIPKGGRYPFVAIVGRPNVGKSTLFNRLVGQRIAITEPTAGTTRDRIAALVELEDGRTFELCDTGGLGGTGDTFDKDVNTQIALALDYADAVVMLVDSRAGLVPLDEKIARQVKQLKKPALLAANKVETAMLEATAGEFYALGLPGEVHCVSAEEGDGRSDLLEAIADMVFPDGYEAAEDEEEDDVLRVAIVGRRNVGKSTFVNQICGAERVIASEQAGTTRDAVDVRVEVDGREVILIDTAGLRKRGRADDQIELISHGRAKVALRRCDVALLFLDCLEDIRMLDKNVAKMVIDEHKACVVVANKWDLVEERMDLEKYAEYCAKMLPNLAFAPVCSISAIDGSHAKAPIELAFELYDQARIKIGTGPLNRALAAAITLRRPKPYRNRLGKIFFGTQVAVNPVTLLVFVNDPMLFPQAYRRYLVNQLRKELPWPEIPLKLVLRARESLYKKGGGLARRVRTLSGLAEQSRWIDNEPSANIKEIEHTLDAQDVQEALLDAFGPRDGDEDEAPE